MPISKESQLGNGTNDNERLRKQLIRDCDRLFSHIVVDGRKCFVSGMPAQDPFHLVPRTVWRWRWSTENVFPISREYHTRWHSGADALDWLEDVAPEKYEFYIAHRWDISKEPDIEYLRVLKEELELVRDSGSWIRESYYDLWYNQI